MSRNEWPPNKKRPNKALDEVIEGDFRVVSDGAPEKVPAQIPAPAQIEDKTRPKGTLHLKENFDVTVDHSVEKEPFDSSEQLRRANTVLNTLRQSIYTAGSNTTEVAAQWKKALDLHGSILRSIQEYQTTKDPEKRLALETSIPTKIARLAGPREEDIRQAYQEARRPLPENEQAIGEDIGITDESDEDVLPETFDRAIKNAVEGERLPEDTDVQIANDDEEPTPVEVQAVDAESQPEPEPEDDQPIVMVNPVLTKIAMGGKKPKKPKEPKARKEHASVSEGGTVYKGHVFTENEPIMAGTDAAAETIDTGPEPVVIRGAPETHAEYRGTLRRSVEQIENEIRAKRNIIRSLEETARHKHGEAADDVESHILNTEHDVRSLEKERIALEKATDTKAANENRGETGTIEVPVVREEDSEMEARAYGPNIIDLAAKRAERMEAAGKKKKRNFITAAIISLFGMSSAASTPNGATQAPEKHKPAPATSHAPGAATRAEAAAPGSLQGLHQEAESPHDAPKPIILPRQEHAAEMAHHHRANVRAEAVARSHRSVDPDRSEEIAGIYAKELAEHGLKPGTDPGGYSTPVPGRFAEMLAEIHAKKETPPSAPAVEPSASVMRAEERESVPAPAAESAAPAREARLNPNGVPVASHETHIYKVKDAASGEESIVVFGGGTMSDESFRKQFEAFLKDSETNKETKGKTFYFDPGMPTDVNGYPQSWIAGATYDRQRGVVYEVLPEPRFVGAAINPDAFIGLVK